jgi:protein TonB
MRIARHDPDRARWQDEVSDARQQLFASETRIASVGTTLAARAPAANRASANAAAASGNHAPAGAAQNPSGGSPTPAATRGAAQPPAASADGAKRDNSPVAVGSLAAKARQRVQPSYPQIAKVARVTGVVTVYLIVNEKGEVESVQRSDGPAQLQQAAAEAARRWKFHPTVVDGQTVRVTGYVSFNFTGQ